MQVTNGSGLPISDVGHSILTGDSNSCFHLNNVLHVPRVSKHLLLVQKFAYDNSVFFEFHPSYFLVKD